MDGLTTSQTPDATSDALERRRAAFDERYGAGAYDDLRRALSDTTRSFADIAAQFGVTRERVRQWRAQWLAEAPGAQQRRRQRTERAEKRRLLLDPLFRAFHRHARAVFGASRIHVFRGRRGYRTRDARIDGRTVALRDLTRGSASATTTRAPRYRGRADFIYFRLPGDEFLFVAARDAQPSTQPRNTFAALDAHARVDEAAFSLKEHSL